MTREISRTPAMLFDFDGRFIDSAYQHVLAWQHETLQELGLSLGVWRIHRRIGMSEACWFRLSSARTVGG
jgi:beta-phosphoglucomutase-like phosphatase (HAD superfamily)